MVTGGLALALGEGLLYKRFTITHADLTDTDTEQTINLFTLGKGSKVLGVNIKHSVAFAGGTINAVTVSVGSAIVGAAGFAAAYDIFAAVANTSLQETAGFKSGGYDAQTVYAVFTSTAGNLDTATAGSVDIDILVADVTTPL